MALYLPLITEEAPQRVYDLDAWLPGILPALRIIRSLLQHVHPIDIMQPRTELYSLLSACSRPGSTGPLPLYL